MAVCEDNSSARAVGGCNRAVDDDSDGDVDSEGDADSDEADWR